MISLFIRNSEMNSLWFCWTDINEIGTYNKYLLIDSLGGTYVPKLHNPVSHGIGTWVVKWGTKRQRLCKTMERSRIINNYYKVITLLCLQKQCVSSKYESRILLVFRFIFKDKLFSLRLLLLTYRDDNLKNSLWCFCGPFFFNYTEFTLNIIWAVPLCIRSVLMY